MDKLANLPGSYKLPVIGSSLHYLLTDRRTVAENNISKYGSLYKVSAFGNKIVILSSPEANKLVLTNKNNVFSNKLGWRLHFGKLAQGTLLATDNDQHTRNRTEISKAFTPVMRETYQATINRYFENLQIDDEVTYYDFANTCIVDLLHQIALGGNISPEARQNAIDVIESAAALIKYPIPGSRFYKGMKAKKALQKAVKENLNKENFSIYSYLKKNSNLSDKNIFNECVFMLIAGNPTTSVATTSMMHFLLENPKWMSLVQEEVRACPTSSPDLEQLKAMENLTLVFKESIRLYPPLHTIPRVNVKEFEYNGHTCPANTIVAIVPDTTCRLESVWENAREFRPERFNEPLTEEQKWAYIPFGAGAHRCVGALLGESIAKLITFHILRRFNPVAKVRAEGFNYAPVPKPKQGLPLRLNSI